MTPSQGVVQREGVGGRKDAVKRDDDMTSIAMVIVVNCACACGNRQ